LKAYKGYKFDSTPGLDNSSEAVKKAVDSTFTLWLVFITLRYGQTVLKSVATPFNPGRDIEV
jgi:hypothetical protein